MVRLVGILICITFLGALLRFFNLSPFTVYPDSYQNLIVAENIRTYGSVVGYLGKNGMLYPDFFMWTRPLFPLLINAVSFFSLTSLTTARSIAFVLGILAIPLTYLFIRRVFKQINIGLFGAFLLALSYNHTVWSGLLMTEAIGVFFMLMFLWRFFATVEKKVPMPSLQNIVTGFLFCLAVLARYEYLIIALPVIFYIFKHSPQPMKYVVTVFIAMVIGLLITGFLLFPVNSVILVLFSQLSDLLIKITVAIGIIALCYLVYRFLPIRYKAKIATFLPIVLSIIFVVLFFFGKNLTALKNFINHDYLLCFFALIGLLTLLADAKQRVLAYFVLLSIGLLGFIYHQINPDMERYFTHLIPFLLIPASFGLLYFFKTAFVNQTKSIRYLFFALLSFLIFYQIVVTARGLRYLNDPSWYSPSYEDTAAHLVKKYISGHPLLITSHPEPYYYFTGLDTQSIADTPPFLYLPPVSYNQQIVIIEDMGMHADFPRFTSVLYKRLQKYKYDSFRVDEGYHESKLFLPENSPVVLYKISFGELHMLMEKKQ